MESTIITDKLSFCNSDGYTDLFVETTENQDLTVKCPMVFDGDVQFNGAVNLPVPPSAIPKLTQLTDVSITNIKNNDALTYNNTTQKFNNTPVTASRSYNSIVQRDSTGSFQAYGGNFGHLASDDFITASMTVTDLQAGVVKSDTKGVLSTGTITTNNIENGSITDSKLASSISQTAIANTIAKRDGNGNLSMNDCHTNTIHLSSMIGSPSNYLVGNGQDGNISISNESIVEALHGSGIPSSSNYQHRIGCIYVDDATHRIYVLVKVSGQTATWVDTSASGGGMGGTVDNLLITSSTRLSYLNKAGFLTNDNLGILSSTDTIDGSYITSNSLDGSKIQDYTVNTKQLSDLAVTNSKIADSAVSNSKIANGTIAVNKLQTATPEAVTGFESVATRDVSGETKFKTVKCNTLSPEHSTNGTISMTGDVAFSNPPRISSMTSAGFITNDNTGKLSTIQTISGSDITNSSITNGKIATGTITADKISSSSIDTASTASTIAQRTNNGSLYMNDCHCNTCHITNNPFEGFLKSEADGNVVVSTDHVVSCVKSQNNPTSSDYNYPIGKMWINQANNTIHQLTNVSGNTATWVDVTDISTIMDNTITTSKIVDQAVTNQKIADGAISNVKIANATIGINKLQTATHEATTGYETIPTRDISGDAKFKKIFCNDLTPENTTNNTIQLSGDLIFSNPPKITSMTNAGVIVNDSTGKLSSSSSISGSYLTNQTVTTDKIADGSITNQKVTSGTLTLDRFSPSENVMSCVSFTRNPLSTDYNYPIGKMWINQTTNTIFQLVNVVGIVATWIDMINASTTQIADGSVTTVKLADNAVTYAKIADGAVSNVKIATGTIGIDKLQSASTEVSASETLMKRSTTGYTKIKKLYVDELTPQDTTANTLKVGGMVTITNAPQISAFATAGYVFNDATGLLYTQPTIGGSYLTNGTVTLDKLSTTAYASDSTASTLVKRDSSGISSFQTVLSTAFNALSGTDISLNGFTVRNSTNKTISTSGTNDTMISSGGNLSMTCDSGNLGTKSFYVLTGSGTRLSVDNAGTSIYNTLKTNTIQELTSSSGVTISSLLILTGGLFISGLSPSSAMIVNAMGKVATGLITDGMIQSLDGLKLYPLSVTADAIGNGEISETKIADGAVTTTKIANATITNAKLSETASIATANYIALRDASGNIKFKSVYATGILPETGSTFTLNNKITIGDNSTLSASRYLTFVPYAFGASQYYPGLDAMNNTAYDWIMTHSSFMIGNGGVLRLCSGNTGGYGHDRMVDLVCSTTTNNELVTGGNINCGILKTGTLQENTTGLGVTIPSNVKLSALTGDRYLKLDTNSIITAVASTLPTTYTDGVIVTTTGTWSSTKNINTYLTDNTISGAKLSDATVPNSKLTGTSSESTANSLCLRDSAGAGRFTGIYSTSLPIGCVVGVTTGGQLVNASLSDGLLVSSGGNLASTKSINVYLTDATINGSKLVDASIAVAKLSSYADASATAGSVCVRDSAGKGYFSNLTLSSFSGSVGQYVTIGTNGLLTSVPAQSATSQTIDTITSTTTHAPTLKNSAGDVMFSINRTTFSTSVGTGRSITTGVSNVAVGHTSGFALNGANYNTMVGVGSGYATTTGGYNTFVGYNAGSACTTGTDNVLIGYNAGSAITTGSNNIRIATGASGWGTSNNVIQIGNDSHTYCYIGSATKADNSMTLVSKGTVGSNSGFGSNAMLYIDSQGIIHTAGSSRKIKENIIDVPSDISSNIYKLRPVQFNYIKTPHETCFGLIAEEVETVIKQLAIYDKNDQPCNVAYHQLPPLMLAEMQKMRKEVDVLKQENETLKSTLSNVLSRLEALENKCNVSFSSKKPDVVDVGQCQIYDNPESGSVGICWTSNNSVKYVNV